MLHDTKLKQTRGSTKNVGHGDRLRHSKTVTAHALRGSIPEAGMALQPSTSKETDFSSENRDPSKSIIAQQLRTSESATKLKKSERRRRSIEAETSALGISMEISNLNSKAASHAKGP